jgi:hypothetical protein
MISLGTDFVAGKKRVPNPATGNIALVILFRIYLPLTNSERAPLLDIPLLMEEKGEENWSKFRLFVFFWRMRRTITARSEISPEKMPALRWLQFDRGRVGDEEPWRTA